MERPVDRGFDITVQPQPLRGSDRRTMRVLQW
jgi:hypothetical protein